jgi:hypothetical protein
LDADRLKVLISYSRADMAFADEQVAGLEYDGGSAISVARNAVSEGEDWKVLLGTLIADADTVVSILSPKAATKHWRFRSSPEKFIVSPRFLMQKQRRSWPPVVTSGLLTEEESSRPKPCDPQTGILARRE